MDDYDTFAVLDGPGGPSPPSSPPMSLDADDDNDDNRSFTDNSSLYYQTSSAAMSVFDADDNHRSMPSPAPSVYSVTESIRQQSYRVEYGRIVNNHSDVYGLPADEEETYRLNEQHEFFTHMFGPFPPILHEILRLDPHVQKAVIDLGCGSGAWIFDIARTFPHCRTIGVDLVPVPGPSPHNFISEIDDINLGLQHHYSQYDVVHTRFVAQGIQHYEDYINQMARCLRPRGLLIICEFDFKVYRLDRIPYPPWGPSYAPNGLSVDTPFLCHWFNALNNAIISRGGSLAAQFIHDWVKRHPFFDPEEVTYQEMYFPFGPYKLNQELAAIGYDAAKLSRIGDMVRHDVHSFLRGGRVMLLSNEMSPGDVDLLENPAHTELDNMRHPGLAKVITVYARRRANVENTFTPQWDQH